MGHSQVMLFFFAHFPPTAASKPAPCSVCSMSAWGKPHLHPAQKCCGGSCLHRPLLQLILGFVFHLNGKVLYLLTSSKAKLRMYLILPAVRVTAVTLRLSHQKSPIHTADGSFTLMESNTHFFPICST